MSLWLPRDAIIMMVHCAHGLVDGEIKLYAETHHARWMLSKLTPEFVFLDVGASVGEMTIPTALTTPCRVFAFEPARRQRSMLLDGIKRNNAERIEVIEAAVSNSAGTATFYELTLDETQEMAIAPQGSHLSANADHTGAEKYTVDTIALNDFCRDRDLFGTHSVIKIDVEGFEVQVLEGATDYLRATRSHLSIDIHGDPFGQGTTDNKVIDQLTPLNYRFERVGHVLLCTPG